mgnify:CR=1 FL=1
MEVIKKKGLFVSGIWGEHVVRKLRTYTEVPSLMPWQPDVVFITVKSYDTETAVRQILPKIGQETLICSFQNGLGNVETIARCAGRQRTIAARVIFGVRLKEPGSIVITVIAEPSAIGPFSREAPRDKVRALASEMDKAGLPTIYVEEIMPLIWAKVAYNSALNPLSALLNVPYGALLKAEESRQIMRNVIHELYEVAKACGVRLQPPTAELYVKKLFEELIPPTSAHYASMREDFLSHRRTEIDALNGAIVRLGKERGISCPTNELLTKLVKARERTYSF